MCVTVCSHLHRLGLAYAGSMRDDVIDVLTPVMWEEKTTFEVRHLY